MAPDQHGYAGPVPDATAQAPGPQRCRFGPIEVCYDERVLQPRPWTLAQSRWAAELAGGAGPGPLLELCAGAGHIGLAAAVLADRDLVQVELDPWAAAHAEGNARRAGWGGRVEVRVGSIDEAVGGDERYPVVIADPPYLRTEDLSRFPEDPRLAIDGGADGLAVLRRCLAAGARHLPPGGPLVLQVAGPRQADAVAALAVHEGLEAGETRVVDDERAILLLRRAT
jgi:release factor glutamine methyltransferase